MFHVTKNISVSDSGYGLRGNCLSWWNYRGALIRWFWLRNT